MSLTPARWHQIANVYELAVERQPSEREAFLFEACAGDELLRREVEALLRRDGAETLLDRPIWSTAAALFEHRSAVVAGTMLGPYRVERLLGAGGMGEVFRAVDHKQAKELSGATGGHGFLIWLPLKDLQPGRYLLVMEARSRLDNDPVQRETLITVK